MENSEDITGGLSPLEQRRERLRTFADRVLEAVEALPMPKNAADSERTLRAIATADRMLVQLYKKNSLAADRHACAQSAENGRRSPLRLHIRRRD